MRRLGQPDIGACELLIEFADVLMELGHVSRAQIRLWRQTVGRMLE